ncbi:hypothetical protein [Sphingobium yanoikuyae]|uniref:hypothetical protein n=1 Tax=Sphingobium yanoikuyae TaxID=13690 RepID=UPI0028993021|nr:hypothetical protein [Sphingobium yanoikuyae]
MKISGLGCWRGAAMLWVVARQRERVRNRLEMALVRMILSRSPDEGRSMHRPERRSRAAGLVQRRWVQGHIMIADLLANAALLQSFQSS